MRLHVLLFLLLPCACFASLPTHIYYSTDPALAADVSFGLRQWNAALDGALTIDQADTTHPANVIVTTDDTEFLLAPITAFAAYTDTHAGVSRVYLRSSVSKMVTWRRSVILHELGHALGIAQHLVESSAIMHDSIPYNKPPLLTSWDVSAIRKLYGLGPIDLSFSITVQAIHPKQRWRLLSVPYPEFVQWDFGDGIQLYGDGTQYHKWPKRGIYAPSATYLGVSATVTLFEPLPKKPKK